MQIGLLKNELPNSHVKSLKKINKKSENVREFKPT